MEELMMLQKMKPLNVVYAARIAKKVLSFVIVGFFFIQCENPLGSLLDDVSIRSDKDKLLISEGRSGSIGFRLNAKPINQEIVTLRANLTCKEISISEQNSHVTVNKNAIIWGENNWSTWQYFRVVAHKDARRKPMMNCELLSAPLQSNDGGFNELTVKAIPITILYKILLTDSDHDGLIEIKNATMLNNMRYDLTGTSYKTSASDAGDSSGCPPVVNGSGGCYGYELSTNIDLLSLLDKNKNGKIDTTMEGIDNNADGDTTDIGEQVSVIDTSKDISWIAVGDASSNAFRGTFEGNNHTIANLWVNVASSSGVYAGLFGVTSGIITIRNVGIISGSIYSSASKAYSGGLVGSGQTVNITNSYFGGGGDVFSSSSSSASYSGGLVGRGRTVSITNSSFGGRGILSSASTTSYSGGLVGDCGTVSITNSYFGGGGVFSSASASKAYSGGLVGRGQTVHITNSYFGRGQLGVFSSSSSSASYSGGLVGLVGTGTTVSIINSYFGGGGGVFSSAYSGGLVGLVGTGTTVSITNSYWNTTPSQSPSFAEGNAMMNPQSVRGLTLMELKATSSRHPSGLPSGTGSAKAWNLGTASQLPAIKECVDPAGVITVTCSSYGALLPGQR